MAEMAPGQWGNGVIDDADQVQRLGAPEAWKRWIILNTSRNRLINIPILDATGAPRFLGTVFVGRDHIRTLMAKCHGNN